MPASPVSSQKLAPSELRRRREAAALSTYELAQLLDVSPALVQHWEAGRKPVPRGRVGDLQRVFASLAPVAEPTMTGAQLRQLRERAGLSQTDVAELVGVSREALGAWERGAKPVPEAHRDILRKALAAEAPTAAVMQELRKQVGWKQAELAERIGSNQSEVSIWECGEIPVPVDRWPAIRDVLTAAERYVRPQQEVTAGEIQVGVRALNWTLGDLARALGIPRGTIGPWASGAKKVPPGRWSQIREVLGTAAPAVPAGPRDRVAEALPLVLAVIETEEGLGRQEVISRVDAAEPHARGAIQRLLEHDRIHERPWANERADGVVRYLPALFPGPAPAELPRIDRADVVVPKVVAAVKASPGRTRRAIAEALPHDRRLAESAIVRAVDKGAVHARAVIRHTSRGQRLSVGLFPGDPPTPSPALLGATLLQLRKRLAIDQDELAERLGVTPGLVGRWERSEVPDGWRSAVRELLRPVSDDAQARDGELCQRIIEAVRVQPGMPRWGDLVRLLHGLERSRLRELLDELIAAGELHERPLDNRHGAGLFLGPAPAEWAPGEPISPGELHEMRTWAGFTQKELAEQLRASVASVNAWEQGTKPIPAYRRAQLRRALTDRKPPEPEPLPAEVLAAERRRVGWTQTELARLVGVSQAAITRWERDTSPVPPEHRDRLREILAGSPTRVRGNELHSWRRHHRLTSSQLGELLGVSSAVAEKWQQRGVPFEHGGRVRQLLDASAQTQAPLFE